MEYGVYICTALFFILYVFYLCKEPRTPTEKGIKQPLSNKTEENVTLLMRQYLDRPLVTECANEVFKEFEKQLQRRDDSTQIICFELGVIAEYDIHSKPFQCKELLLEHPALWTKSTTVRPLLHFKTKNIKTPENASMANALMWAIAEKTVSLIRAAYVTDLDGADYTLQTAGCIMHGKHSKKPRGYAVLIRYTAKNGGYLPPQDW